MVYKGGGLHNSPSCIFIGNLPERVDERDIRDLFGKYGEIAEIEIKRGKTSNFTSYAFVEFYSIRAAEDAVEYRDGYEYARQRLRVEFAGEKKNRSRDQYYRESRYDAPVRTDYRVIISGLPHGCRWQHLKEHMLKAGPVAYVCIEDGRGYVDYIHKSDMKYALRKLDGVEIRTSRDSSRIRIRRDDCRPTSPVKYRSRSRGRYTSPNLRHNGYRRADDRRRSISPRRAIERKQDDRRRSISPRRAIERKQDDRRRSISPMRENDKHFDDRERSTSFRRSHYSHRSTSHRKSHDSYSDDKSNNLKRSRDEESRSSGSLESEKKRRVEGSGEVIDYRSDSCSNLKSNEKDIINANEIDKVDDNDDLSKPQDQLVETDEKDETKETMKSPSRRGRKRQTS